MYNEPVNTKAVNFIAALIIIITCIIIGVILFYLIKYTIIDKHVTFSGVFYVMFVALLLYAIIKTNYKLK